MSLTELRAGARKTLQGRWLSFAGYTFVILLLTAAIPNMLEKIDPKDTFGIGTILSILYSLLVVNAIQLGVNALYLKVSRGEEGSLGTIFAYFSNGGYAKAILFYVLMGIYLFLWSLLLVIPGIIKGFSYAMAPFIRVDEPELTANEVITKSRRMMDGYKWKLFCLYLTFLGWLLLSVLTLGIGLFWLIPYMHFSLVHFYRDLKKKQS